MTASLLAGLIAMVVAALLTPLVRRFAIAVGAIDVPGGRRIHVAATPRLGGVAILVAYLAAVLSTLSPRTAQHFSGSPTALWAFLGCGLLIALTGAFDDIRALGAKRKLLVQSIVGTISWFGSVRILSTIYVPGIGPIFIGEPLSFVATLIWIIAFINAINLIDGLDGLAGGVAFFAAVTNLVVAIVTHNILAAVLNAALGGAVLGFLFYNFNPATIFMGDTGSMFLGYALGGAALISGRQKESTVVSLLVPIIALGLPFTDALLATIRRVLARRSIFAADREHLHHRLLDLGHRRAVLILYVCSLLLCASALAAALGRSWQVGVAITGAVLVLIGVTRFAGYFEVVLLRRKQRSAALFYGPSDALRRGLPSLVLSSESASSPAMIWAGLERLLGTGHFAYAEYCPKGEGPVWKWEQIQQHEQGARKIIESSFPIRVYPGGNEGALRFGCIWDDPELPPQIEVLLQIVADVVEAALVRVHVDSPKGMVRAVAPVQES